MFEIRLNHFLSDIAVVTEHFISHKLIFVSEEFSSRENCKSV